MPVRRFTTLIPRSEAAFAACSQASHNSAKKPVPRSFLSGSATGFYGYRGDTEITEATERGTGFLADLCETWEQAANAATDLGIRVVNLRTGIVLGEGGALKKMLYPLPFGVSPFKLGLGGSLGSGKQWVPWIHIQDAVNLILFSLENETITGPINLTSPNPVTNRELTTALGKQLHRPIFFSVPASLLRLATGEIANDLLSSQRVLPSKAIESEIGRASCRERV